MNRQPRSFSLAQRTAAEAVGTGFLLAAVVGSGIMGERLFDGSTGLALLANSLATGAALAALILAFAPISGAHFNPAVTLASAFERELPRSDVSPYLVAQILGGAAGVIVANAMFELPAISLSQHARGGPAQLLSEFVATFGLIATIAGCARFGSTASVAAGVAAYITAAYWFTASTSFANPAVTLARTLTDTFSGIRAADAPAFLVAQLAGAGAAAALFRWLVPRARPACE